MTNYFYLGWEGGFCCNYVFPSFFYILKTIILLFIVVLKNENEILLKKICSTCSRISCQEQEISCGLPFFMRILWYFFNLGKKKDKTNEKYYFRKEHPLKCINSKFQVISYF